MHLSFRRVVVSLLFVVILASSALAQGIQVVGIPSSQMDPIAAHQENSEWCWAACIKMVLQKYGISVTQDEIVRRTFVGNNPFFPAPNLPGSFNDITRNLSGWHTDLKGRCYSVGGVEAPGIPRPADFIEGLKAQYPTVLALATGPNTGHAVVATGATYIDTPQGPYVLSVMIRDPWPYPDFPMTNGKRQIPASVFGSVTAYWTVGVDIKPTGTKCGR
jgi:hypothetical protein